MAVGEEPPRTVPRVQPVSADHRATTFELLFDLVYVFAATQVTAFMAHEHTAIGVVRGLLVLGLLWWTWAAYAWLGNQGRADEGLLRATMAVATVAMFIVALTVPEAWDDAPGGLNGPLVMVCAYLVVRICTSASTPWRPAPTPASATRSRSRGPRSR